MKFRRKLLDLMFVLVVAFFLPQFYLAEKIVWMRHKKRMCGSHLGSD